MRSTRRLLLLAAIVALTPQVGVAQRVGLEVTLSADTLVDGRTLRLPTIKLTDLLDDGRWGNALRTSLPLRLQFELEIWRSRDGWIDQFERALAFEVLIRHEALFDHYTVTQRQAGGAREQVLASWEALEQYLAGGYKLIVRPSTTGTYYYVAKVMITTLSEADLDELERFVQGRAPAEAERRGQGRVGLMRFLLRMTGGLPVQTLETRSGRVVVR
jgi:hypothetical protein